jgi:hypothetical protein
MINSHREEVMPEFVSPLVFDHAIVAIRLPSGTPTESFIAAFKTPK